jgi:hypothetical protein
MDRLPAIPVIDLRDGGPVRHAERNPAPARALRDACLAFFPRAVQPFVPALDSISRRWLKRSRSPYLPEIAQLAEALGFSGVWLLNASYQWGCTARASDEDGVPWLLRTLDWPFHRRFFQRHLAGLCRRIDRARPVAFCGLRQSGADAPPHDSPLAARL